MKEMNKKNYMSPMVEILNARVEKGFAGSSIDPHGPINGDLEGIVPNADDPNTDGSDFD